VSTMQFDKKSHYRHLSDDQPIKRAKKSTRNA
jgi:hypothetical protein